MLGSLFFITESEGLAREARWLADDLEKLADEVDRDSEEVRYLLNKLDVLIGPLPND